MGEKIPRLIFRGYELHMLRDAGMTAGSQGIYAGEVGVPRLLKLFKKYEIKTTWFIPGKSPHSIRVPPVS